MATTPNRGYQLPAASSKLKDDVLRLVAALGAIDTDVANLLLAVADKSDVGHGHAMEAITGLVAALGNKLDVGYHDALANLTDVDVAGVANGMALLRQASKWIPVALQINNIAGLETALSSKATPADISAAINALVAAAPGALDTLNELATALGNDPDFAATVSAALGNRVRADAAQAFTAAQKGQARANIGADVLAGFRNKLINGKFDIWQRGTTFAASGVTLVYVADRWIAAAGTGGAATISRNPLLGPSENRNSLAWAQTGAASTSPYLQQRIEGVDTFSGGDATLTFETLGGAAITVQPRIVQHFGSGGSSDVVTLGTPISVASGGKFSQKIAIPSVAGKTVGSGDYLRVDLVFPSGVSFTEYFTKVSFVKGDATAEADPFSPRHIQQELALCQRYFEKSFPVGTTPANGASATSFATEQGLTQIAVVPWGGGTAGFHAIVPFKVTKRASPAITRYGNNSGHWTYDNAASGLLSSGARNAHGSLFLDANGPDGLFVNNQVSTNSLVAVQGHWTADAEF